MSRKKRYCHCCKDYDCPFAWTLSGRGWPWWTMLYVWGVIDLRRTGIYIMGIKIE